VQGSLSQSVERAEAKRRWWRWVVLSLVLHLPLSPAVPLLGLVSLFLGRVELPEEPKEALEGIPIEFLEEDGPKPSPDPTPEQTDSTAVIVSPQPVRPQPLAVADAGVPPTPDGGADGGLDGGVERDGGLDSGVDRQLDGGIDPDGGFDGGVDRRDAGPDHEPDGGLDGGLRVADAGIPPDPLSIKGPLTKLAPSNANVRIHFFVDALGRHPAGAVIGELLMMDPEWQSLLGSSGIDPIRDLDQVVLYGPQLVRTRELAAIVAFDQRVEDVERRVSGLVRAFEGTVEKHGSKTVGRAVFDGAPRVLVTYPNRVVAMVPDQSSAARDAVAVERLVLPSPADAEDVVVAALKTPHRVRLLRRLGLTVPESIETVRVVVSSLRNGGARVRLTALDASSESALAHQELLTPQLTRLSGGFVRFKLETKGRELLGEAELTGLQIGFILSQIRQMAEEQSRPRPAREAKTPPAASLTPKNGAVGR